MKTRHLTTVIAALTLVVSAGVSADGIYKWVDDEGNVHYEDRPSGAAFEEQLQFSYNRTDSSAVQKRVQARQESSAALREARNEAAADKRTDTENRAAADEKLAKCKEYRANMKTMLESPRLYRLDDAGERVYMDDNAREQARQKAEKLINENCNG